MTPAQQHINDNRRKRYATDPEYRALCKQRSVSYYQNMTEEQRVRWRENRRLYQQKRRQQKQAKRVEQAILARKERERKKKERQIKSQIKKQRYIENVKTRYHNDPEYRAMKLQRTKAYHDRMKDNPEYIIRRRVLYRRRYMRKKGIAQPSMTVDEEVRLRLLQTTNIPQ